VKRRLLALSSGGGHWIELLRLTPAFSNIEISFATVNCSNKEEVSGLKYTKFYTFDDVTRWNKIRWVKTAIQILRIIIKVRPHYIVTTGALPGYMAIRIGKLIGAKTVWIDSIANAGELSTAGKYAGKHVDLWLTQWEHLSGKTGPYYKGAVL